jgi:hypothetical protein
MVRQQDGDDFSQELAELVVKSADAAGVASTAGGSAVTGASPGGVAAGGPWAGGVALGGTVESGAEGAVEGAALAHVRHPRGQRPRALWVTYGKRSHKGAESYVIDVIRHAGLSTRTDCAYRVVLAATPSCSFRPGVNTDTTLLAIMGPARRKERNGRVRH